ncbi:alpha/beta fold hydrolase [Streptomyces chartreusis]
MSTWSGGGITLGYEDEGSGMPVVLVHGHPFDRTMWRPQVEHFSQAGWRVITPDLRGYGESMVVPGRTTLDVFARDIAGLLDHLGIDRFVLGGLSMGGQIVMEFHRLFPDRVRGLLFADTFAAADTEDSRTWRYEMAERLLREGMGGYANQVLPKMMTPQNIQALPRVAEHVLAMMAGASAEGAAAGLRGRAERPDYTGMLQDIAVPTLVVVGSDDEFTPVSDARLIHERVPHSTLAIIDGAGHMPNLERPAEFNAALGLFLDALSDAQAKPSTAQ